MPTEAVPVRSGDPDPANLTSAQCAALSHVERLVRRQEATSHQRVNDALHRAQCAADTYDEVMACVRVHARVVLHFHPDRVGSKPMTVAEALLSEGIYRSQFETGLSSGSLSAFPGGPRDAWEHRLFGGAYDEAGVNNSERPKYGALELVRYPDGPIPRFGSCYFVLRQNVAERTSFTFAGSEDPRATDRLGTLGRMDNVMAELFAEIEGGGMAAPPWPPYHAPTLGVQNLTIPRLLEVLKALALPRPDPADQAPGRVLDTQIEAQAHGTVDLRRDVELLVADPAFAPTPTGVLLRELAARYEFALCWHCGFRLAVRHVPDNFRGPAMPRLAERIAGRDGTLDAAVIGIAEASLQRRPEAWRDWGSHAEALQQLKQLWHVLVHYGASARGPKRLGGIH
jgi:Protein of unknown function (DUF3626)